MYLNGALCEEHKALWNSRLTETITPGLFVAEEEQQIVGFVYLRPVGDGRILLDNLHARPDRRGAGIGSGLVDAGLTWAAATFPGSAIYLEVLRENTSAIAFYERSGWRRTGTGTASFNGGLTLPEYEYTWTPPCG
ncbi:GNAT family N-acetyltransferase [Nocardia fluminea]|uniref:GNAT family N-acetyltransferase n=1 Tax=Nocardia fluminea TaxID=134984 RepID=UPI00364E989E